MDCGTGKIHYFDADQLHEKQKALGRKLAPLSDEQARTLSPMTAKKRKGWMRNQPCVCGSGIKFKRCCWYDYQ